MPLEDLKPIYIIVTGEPSDDEDETVPGIYVVGVSKELTSGDQREAVLDQFHLHIGISVLDDFEIEVVDETGKELDVIEEYESGSLEGEADFWGDINEDDAPAAVFAIYSAKVAQAAP
jgi:hypothetical protein